MGKLSVLVKNSAGLSNRILLRNLLHLSRIVVFGALPVIVHLDYVEYMRWFFSNPPEPGDPLPTPAPYPIPLVTMAIAVIVFDLIVLWKGSSGYEGYEIHTSFMFVVELVLLLIIPNNYLAALGVFLFGILQMLVIAKM